MNRFEFEDLQQTPSNGVGRICRWLVLAVLLTSTNLEHLPWYAAKLGVKVAAARAEAAEATVATNSAFAAAARSKAIDAGTSQEWATVYNAFGTTGSTPLK